MYYVELVYLDDQGEEITHETVTLYSESEAEAHEDAYKVFTNSTADDYQLKQD